MFQIVQKDDGGLELIADSPSASTTASVKVTYASGIDVELGRGTTDTDRTYVALRRSDGTKVYIYVDTGTTVLCSATAP